MRNNPRSSFIQKPTIRMLPIGILLAVFSVVHASDGENWQWQLKAGQLQQHYHELDNNDLTPDGILNSETGTMPTIALSVVNTLNNMQIGDTWTPYGKFDIRYTSGKTDYDGYLQSGNSLTAYQTQTDNSMLHSSLAFGGNKQITESLHVKPNLAISHYQWQRELEQYSEDFRHTALLAGLTLDWQPRANQPMSLQATGQAGKIIDSNIDVADLGLNQNIGNAGIWRIGINGNYKLTNNLSLNAGVSRESWQYEQSDTENGYVYPDSENEQTLWEIGLGYEF